MSVETVNRGYVYSGAPTSDETESYFRQCFGADRLMYNLHVAHLYEYLEKNGHTIGDKLPTFKEMVMPTVKEFKQTRMNEEGNKYLYEVDAFASNEAKQHFNKAISLFNKNAFKGQFKKSVLKRQKTLGIEPTFRDLKGMPKFHSRKNSKLSYTTFNQNDNIFIGENNVLHLPTAQKSKLSEVTIKLNIHRPLPTNSRIKNVTITMNAQGKFEVSINVEFEMEVESIGIPAVERILGLDYSQANFFVDNEGKKANYPHYYRDMEERLAKEQRKLSHMVKGSKRWKRQRLVVVKLHMKVANQRKDWLHKKAYALANRYDMVVVEDLDLRAIGQTLKLAKNQQDNGFGNFRLYLKYKLEQQGKYFVKAPKSFASTQICSDCGVKNTALKGDITTREWTCNNCHEWHDRDHNAGLNLRNYGIRWIDEVLLAPSLVVA
ncbi:RNA-guided endonuclease InsQ/TnpB family protein [Trichococcus paludicola]|uniref:RNA-guided endonuclease InsQ/TnpB family protein n=1 Tax=Trichococcus paludicola TaxID=2052942 RepID=UPI000D3AC287|nr:RNA-guided endonuclease TnpB family protein [Trichococcus paludicola]